MLRVLPAAVLACAVIGASAHAGTIVTGTESFDSSTGENLYSYTLDNTTGTGRVDQFLIEVNPNEGDQAFAPDAVTLPTGWTEFNGVGFLGGTQVTFLEFVLSQVANPQPGGTIDWILPGQVLSGFSFETPFAPFQGTYLTFGDSSTSGTVVAPNDPTPEPSTIALACVGLVGAVGVRVFRRRAA